MVQINYIEHDGLQNVAGLILKNLLKKKKSKKTEYSKIAVQILSSTILDNYDDQALINLQSRGGLTAVNRDAQRIIVLAEEKYCEETKFFQRARKVDIENAIDCLLKNFVVKSHINTIMEHSGIGEIAPEIIERLFSEIFRLFMNVRSHSLSQDIIEKYRRKMKDNKLKKGALRKSLKKNEEKEAEAELRH